MLILFYDFGMLGDLYDYDTYLFLCFLLQRGVFLLVNPVSPVLLEEKLAFCQLFWVLQLGTLGLQFCWAGNDGLI